MGKKMESKQIEINNNFWANKFEILFDLNLYAAFSV